MKPTNKEIIEKLKVLIGWCIRSDSDLSYTAKKTLSLALASVVEMIRRKYELTSAYYAAAEYEARKNYLEEYENGGKR